MSSVDIRQNSRNISQNPKEIGFSQRQKWTFENNSTFINKIEQWDSRLVVFVLFHVYTSFSGSWNTIPPNPVLLFTHQISCYPDLPHTSLALRLTCAGRWASCKFNNVHVASCLYKLRRKLESFVRIYKLWINSAASKYYLLHYLFMKLIKMNNHTFLIFCPFTNSVYEKIIIFFLVKISANSQTPLKI